MLTQLQAFVAAILPPRPTSKSIEVLRLYIFNEVQHRHRNSLFARSHPWPTPDLVDKATAGACGASLVLVKRHPIVYLLTFGLSSAIFVYRSSPSIFHRELLVYLGSCHNLDSAVVRAVKILQQAQAIKSGYRMHSSMKDSSSFKHIRKYLMEILDASSTDLTDLKAGWEQSRVARLEWLLQICDSLECGSHEFRTIEIVKLCIQLRRRQQSNNTQIRALASIIDSYTSSLGAGDSDSSLQCSLSSLSSSFSAEALSTARRFSGIQAFASGLSNLQLKLSLLKDVLNENLVEITEEGNDDVKEVDGGESLQNVLDSIQGDLSILSDSFCYLKRSLTRSPSPQTNSSPSPRPSNTSEDALCSLQDSISRANCDEEPYLTPAPGFKLMSVSVAATDSMSQSTDLSDSWVMLDERAQTVRRDLLVKELRVKIETRRDWEGEDDESDHTGSDTSDDRSCEEQQQQQQRRLACLQVEKQEFHFQMKQDGLVQELMSAFHSRAEFVPDFGDEIAASPVL